MSLQLSDAILMKLPHQTVFFDQKTDLDGATN